MQWWVNNIDDGFNKKVTDKYVLLEDIDSIPRLALWEEIIAVPWEGPTPVDRRGMMPVMFQGGAADHERRLKLVRFIGDFLAKYNFNITIKKDHLNARLKGFEQA